MSKVPTVCPFISKENMCVSLQIQVCIHTHTHHPKNTSIHCLWQFKYVVGPLIFNLDFKRKKRDGDDDSYPHLSFSTKAALLGMLELDPVRFSVVVVSEPIARFSWQKALENHCRAIALGSHFSRFLSYWVVSQLCTLELLPTSSPLVAASTGSSRATCSPGNHSPFGKV